MEKGLLIIGAGGHGTVIADIAHGLALYNTIVFADDAKTGSLCGIPIVCKVSDLSKCKNDYDVIIGIGDNKTRKRIAEYLDRVEISTVSLIHPSSVISDTVFIGPGTVIMPGAIINTGSSIGRNCIVNTGSTIDHDCILGDYVHISPGVHVGGTVRIGEECWVGIGGCVKNNISICSGCMVGAGGVVVKDITERGVYIGVPCKKANF